MPGQGRGGCEIPTREGFPNTLSKSARLGPVEFGKVRDLGRLSCVMCAERFWT